MYSVMNEHKTIVTQKYFWPRLASLTIHFSVGLPFVVPASEWFTVVLSTLLGSEVHRRNGAQPSVTELVETAGAWAKFTIVLRSMTWREEKHEKKKLKTLFWLVLIAFHLPDMLENLNFPYYNLTSVSKQEVIVSNCLHKEALCYFRSVELF